MANNKDLRMIDTTVFLNKLDMLLEYLKAQYQSGTFATQEDVIEEFRRVLSTFYSAATTPFFSNIQARAGTSPSYKDHNTNFQEVRQDLTVLFREMKTLENTVLKNFNFTLSEQDKVNKFVKRVNSKVGDYALYSNDSFGDISYFKDSFNDVSKIDFGSSLLTKSQCEIDTTEGIVTLPLQQTTTPTTKSLNVKINESSGPGGSIGNYQDINATALHDEIRDVLDGNPDSWFEYERVQSMPEENTTPLRLDLTLFFETPDIVNFIRINPNNFGTQTAVAIEEIETSLDGVIWTSIKDDVPIAGYLEEDEANVFKLAPSTSKYAGQGLFTFTPRKVKYIHVILRQDTPYKIQTTGGWKWRYAIGIRDISLQAIPYQADGDIISTAFSSSREIQKISLLASENPAQDSELADVKHQVSVDDGATWYDIQPLGRVSSKAPEILNVNTGLEDSIQTGALVYSVRHRMLMHRETSKFKEGSATLSSIVKDGVDVLGLPKLSPAVLALTRAPIPSTLRLMNPLWGSRALDGIKVIENSGDKQETRMPKIRAIGRSTGQPNQVFRGVISKEIGFGDVEIWSTNNELVLWIDNDSSWDRVGSFSSAGSDKVYTLGNDGTITFGDYDPVATTGDGFVPPAGSVIGFTLKEERLLVSGSSPYQAEFVFASDGDKENVKIYRKDPATLSDNIYLRPGAQVIRLPNKHLIDGELKLFGTGTTYVTEVPFIDGSTEFTSGDVYSIDGENGILYFSIGVPADATDWFVSYSYEPWIELTSADWDYIVDADRKYNRITIKDSAYAAITISGFSIPAGVRVFQLTDPDIATRNVRAVVPGSLSFSTASAFVSGVTPWEVKFIDGVTEFTHTDNSLDLEGCFSVDYMNGLVYISPVDATATSGAGTLSFAYTNFYACYNIAKPLSSSAYSFDATKNTIAISEREILNTWGDRDLDVKSGSLIKAIYDYVHTTRESIEELEPFFTPIVRDVTIKILPKE